MGLAAALVPAVGFANVLPGAKKAPDVRRSMEESSRYFLENKGQWDSRALFHARTSSLGVWVTREGLVFDHQRRETRGDQQGVSGHVVRMAFDGGNRNAKAEGVGAQKLRVDFLNQGRNIRGARTYSKVYLRDVYRGVDVRAHYDGTDPRYDFIVDPGADPAQIRLRFDGVSKIAIDKNGDIKFDSSLGELRHAKLLGYQTVNGKKQIVPVRFQQVGANKVGFVVGKYDRSKPLVIDPLVYGTYYGGDDGWDDVRSVTADADGGVYFTGSTDSPRFPAIYGPYGFTVRGTDAFVSRLQGDVYVHDYAAILGGSLTDVGTAINLDPQGNVWVAGQTSSVNFPGNTRANVTFIRGNVNAGGGTFFMFFEGQRIPASANGNNPDPGVDLPFNASAAQIQTAINNVIGGGAVVTGGPLPLREVRIELPNSNPGSFAFSTRSFVNQTIGYDIEQRPTGQAQVLFQSSGAATAGTFTLTFGGNTTAPIAWNAPLADVKSALEALPNVGNNNTGVFLLPPSTGALPTARILIVFADSVALGSSPAITVNNGGLTGGTYATSISSRQEIRYTGTVTPLPGSVYTLTWRNQATGVTSTTAAIPFNAPAATVQSSLIALPNIGNNEVFATGGVLPTNSTFVHFVEGLTGPQETMTITNNMLPNAAYSLNRPVDAFVIRFAPDGTTVLNPFPTRTQILGGSRVVSTTDGVFPNRDVTLGGFEIAPDVDPLAGEPVNLVLTGVANSVLTQDDYTTPLFAGAGGSFLFRSQYAAAGTFTPLSGAQYIAGAGLTISGLALDSQGNAHIAGSVGTGGVVDTAVDPSPFATTPGVFNRLLRGRDGYVRKYSPSGSLLYSVLVGGNFDDTGVGVAVDNDGNAYLTGISGSFNFPRSRGAYGENFEPRALVYVVKLNRDASAFEYATHLRTRDVFSVKGIAVDPRGNAYVTGETGVLLRFPFPPGDPNEPNGSTLGTVPTTADAIRSANDSPTTPELPTNDGYLLVLNSTGTNLLYGSYIGGSLEEELFAPFTDKFGDVWVFGRIDTQRYYERVSSTGTVTQYLQGGVPRVGGLGAGFLTPNAFKTSIEPFGAGRRVFTAPYGILESPFTGPAFVPTQVTRDGFILRFRIGLPVITSFVMNPSAVAGGAGASTTGTITLSQPAGQGGVDVSLQLSDPTAASFSSSSQQSTAVVTIPQGQTTGTVTVFTAPVAGPVNVDVRATLEGAFKIARFTVSPWLTSLTLAPNSLPGGTTGSGRIRLFQPAPTGGFQVDLLTSNPALVRLPNPARVVVPAGQDTAVFTYDTNGVPVPTNVNITGSALGAGSTSIVTLTPGLMTSLSFTPSRIAAGNRARGRITLNGATGATGFDVNLSIVGAPAGYRFTAPGGSTTITRVVFEPGDRFKEFDVITPFESVNTVRTIVATRPLQGGYAAQTLQAVLNIDAVAVDTLTITPTSVSGGTPASGRVTLASAAPTGGALVRLHSSNTSIARVPATVTVPAGQTGVSFTVSTLPTATTTTATITASRGVSTRSASIQVRNFGVSVSANPGAVLGGLQNSAITVSLSAPAPTGGVVVNLTSNRPSVLSVPTSVTIPAGQRSRTVTGTSFVVSVTTNATITASFGPGADQRATTFVAVRPFGVGSLVFVPNTVQGGSTVVMRVTLDAAAPAGGAVVSLRGDANRNILQLPATVTVAAGRTTQDFVIRTNVVPRNLSTTITATYRGKSASGTVTVTK